MGTNSAQAGAAPALRLAGAAFVAATAAIHIYLYAHYFSAVPTIGPLFLANGAAGIAIGAIIVLRRGGVWPLIGAAFCAATLGAFLWSVRWGLFGYQESLHGPWQERAAAAEIAGTIACLAAALAGRTTAQRSSALRTTST